MEVFIWILVLAAGYFLPSIWAYSKKREGKKRNIGPVVVVNLFLGWTLIGWVVALAMALKED